MSFGYNDLNTITSFGYNLNEYNGNMFQNGSIFLLYKFRSNKPNIVLWFFTQGIDFH